LTRSIHDYFLAKTLDVVRPGGVIAVITSRYTMDRADAAVRRHLSDGSILLGAVRLPNTAFKANAGTFAEQMKPVPTLSVERLPRVNLPFLA
jgi:adenine-specific DNA methylase